MKLHKSDANHVVFHCPGCECSHRLPINGPRVWGWNGSMDAPSFTPSILVNRDTDRRCHSFVIDGKIHFLTDSTHKLAGLTVDIPEWESD